MLQAVTQSVCGAAVLLQFKAICAVLVMTDRLLCSWLDRAAKRLAIEIPLPRSGRILHRGKSEPMRVKQLHLSEAASRGVSAPGNGLRSARLHGSASAGCTRRQRAGASDRPSQLRTASERHCRLSPKRHRTQGDDRDLRATDGAQHCGRRKRN